MLRATPNLFRRDGLRLFAIDSDIMQYSVSNDMHIVAE